MFDASLREMSQVAETKQSMSKSEKLDEANESKASVRASMN